MNKSDGYLTHLHIINDYTVPQYQAYQKPIPSSFLRFFPSEEERNSNRSKFVYINTEPSVELADSVREKLKNGYSRAQMYRDLLELGYSMELIEKAMYGFKPLIKNDTILNANLRKNKETTLSQFFAFANIKITLDCQAVRIPDLRAQIYYKNNILTKELCKEVIDRLKERFVPSTVIDQQSSGNGGYRTSSTAFLGEVDPSLNHRVTNVIAEFMGIDPSYLESLQVQRYEIDQEYKVHNDYFHESSASYQACLGEQGQRTWTCVLYLNDDFKGGGTYFADLDKKVTPREGRAVCWNNLTPLGKPNAHTLHCGQPVLQGIKYIISAWFRECPK